MTKGGKGHHNSRRRITKKGTTKTRKREAIEREDHQEGDNQY